MQRSRVGAPFDDTVYIMRNLAIYLSALAVLHPALAVRHSAHFRDLLAFPKYEVQFLNDLPISSSDAISCQETGLHDEAEYLVLHPELQRSTKIGDGSTAATHVSAFLTM